jgi:hypothetical protein
MKRKKFGRYSKIEMVLVAIVLGGAVILAVVYLLSQQ